MNTGAAITPQSPGTKGQERKQDQARSGRNGWHANCTKVSEWDGGACMGETPKAIFQLLPKTFCAISLNIQTRRIRYRESSSGGCTKSVRREERPRFKRHWIYWWIEGG